MTTTSTASTTTTMNRLRMAAVMAIWGLMLTSPGADCLRPEAPPPMTRRGWLGTASAIIAAAAPPRPASAEPTVLSQLQGPVQDAIAPGHWIGRFAGLNSREETWSFPNHTPQEVSKALVDVLEGLTPERRSELILPEISVKRADSKRVHVLTWTKLEWLDTLDVRFEEVEDVVAARTKKKPVVRGGENGGGGDDDDDETSATTSGGGDGGCLARVSFYATGFVPTSIPGAPLINVGFAWFPFASPGPRGEMLQTARLRILKGLVVQKLREETVTPLLYV